MNGFWDGLAALASSPMMQRSLLAALLVGLTAPVIGTYLVHRRLAMLGDGIGHVSLTGVALGWLVGAAANASPVDRWAVPGAIIVSLLGAVTIEAVRQSGRTSGDVALAMLFYGGIAGGVLFIGIAGGTSAQLNSYLFGSISTVRWSDITTISVLSAAILALGVDVAFTVKYMGPDETRVSLRSRNVDVNAVAAVFGGGGHVRAAGCTIVKPLEEAKAALVAVIGKAL